jgi:hypothetical protein
MNNKKTIKTLDAARSRIAELEAELGGKAPIAAPAFKSSRIAPAGSVTSVHQAPTIDSKAVSGLASMESIQGQINSAKSTADKVSVLQTHIDQRRAALKGMNHSSVEATRSWLHASLASAKKLCFYLEINSI